MRFDLIGSVLRLLLDVKRKVNGVRNRLYRRQRLLISNVWTVIIPEVWSEAL